ncbi:MAG: hypothetical protein ACKVUS_13245 [Saprospiraceae bacterium]
MKYLKWKWAAKAIALGLLFITAITFATMLLWNHLAAATFGLPVLTFFQTLGLMLLGRLLTGGFGSRGSWRGRGPGHRMRGHYWRERWQNMTPEQREQSMQQWGKRGCGPMGAQEKSFENQNTTA